MKQIIFLISFILIHFDSESFFFSGQVNDDVNQSISNLADIPQTIANKNAPKCRLNSRKRRLNKPLISNAIAFSTEAVNRLTP